MRYLKMAGLMVLAAGLTAVIGAGNASATELDNASGMVTTGSTIAMENEGTITLHPPIGDIECTESKIEGTTSNTGSSSETVLGVLATVTASNCNAFFTVLVKGSIEFHSILGGINSANVTFNGFEFTIKTAGGFHCVYKTSGTSFGRLTGSSTTGSNATLDVEATIPRTGGSSGAFCGTQAQMTGSYKVTNPSTLNFT